MGRRVPIRRAVSKGGEGDRQDGRIGGEVEISRGEDWQGGCCVGVVG